MIIIANFLRLCLGEYPGSKSEIISFRLEDIAFICGRSVFAETSMEEELHGATFLTLTFTT